MSCKSANYCLDLFNQNRLTMAETIKGALNSLSAVNQIGFVQFTTGLVNGVFNSIVTSSINQMKEYAELVAAVSKSLSDFIDDEVGTDRLVSANSIISTVFSVNPIPTSNTDIVLSQDQDDIIKSTLGSIVINNKNISDTIGSTLKIKRDLLKDFVVKKMENDATDKFNYLKTLLKLGMQKVVVDKGLIRTKLTFSVRASEFSATSKKATELESRSSLNAAAGIGISKSDLSNFIGSAVAVKQQTTLAVNVVNERSVAAASLSANIIGEVVIEFRTDSFPLINI